MLFVLILLKVFNIFGFMMITIQQLWNNIQFQYEFNLGYGGGSSEIRLGKSIRNVQTRSNFGNACLMTKFLPTWWRFRKVDLINAVRLEFFDFARLCAAIAKSVNFSLLQRLTLHKQ
jgi:hypothetical protein